MEEQKASKSASWGALKEESKSLRSRKSNGYSANSLPDCSWGDLLKEVGSGVKPQEEQAEQQIASGPWSSFSWGEQEWVAKHGPPKPAELVSTFVLCCVALCQHQECI